MKRMPLPLLTLKIQQFSAKAPKDHVEVRFGFARLPENVHEYK